MPQKVLLYNPKAVFYDMPLALLAIGSQLNRDEFEPIIVDGRIFDDAKAEIAKHLDGALCFGVTCLTGAPLKDAIEISKWVKERAPEVPIVWGGWHPSLFPEQPLRELSFVDITVQGQGEETFKELTQALKFNSSLKDVAGITFRDKDDKIVKNKPRVIVDMNEVEESDYSLIEVNKYFEKKGKKQLDFITSAGCFFRCTFCADPFVFSRKFTSLKPEKVVGQLEALQKKYGFTDLNFQDETFFTYKKDILAMAEMLIDRGLKFTWAATMRADQGQRMSDEDFALCKNSGLRRLLIGVESGSQEMMDWLKKDIKMEYVWLCAERCKKLGINVIFPFIVGFPGESDESILATKSMIKELRQMSSGFETPVFYFKPYPGSTITQEVVKDGYVLPKSTMEWSDFDYIGSHGPWVSPQKYREFENLKFYLKLAYKQLPVVFKPVQFLAHKRVKNDWYSLPLERLAYNALGQRKRLS